MDLWKITDEGIYKENIELNGSKFMIGNGYIGYRGTMEEYSKDEMVSCILAGIYDKAGSSFKEPVNAPNGLYTKLFYQGKTPLSCVNSNISEHIQYLDLKNAVHGRETVFVTDDGNNIQVKATRFLSSENVHLMVQKYSFRCSKECNILIETGVNGDIWDMNGPHLKEIKCGLENGIVFLNALTNEPERSVVVAEALDADFGIIASENNDRAILRKLQISAEADREYVFYKYVSIFTSKDIPNPEEAAIKLCCDAYKASYEKLFEGHSSIWHKRWELSDVSIEGDAEAQLALRYSIYSLLIIAPTHSDNASIPARGLSGQVYKGGVFWDTEMFILPFFIYTNPPIAKNLLKYRYNTLDGARRKAREYGYRGAFYAWESQDTGDDSCLHFNQTDVFTGRPIRTYFRDRQIHVSADIVYGIWQYYLITGDESILLEGGAEIIIECSRFYYSYAYFKKDKNRYELLNVTGPDEYHERVDNNAYTNTIVKFVLQTALKTVRILKEKYEPFYNQLIEKLNCKFEIQCIDEMNKMLFIPMPDSVTSIIEQFDRYSTLEDIDLDELNRRKLNPNEFLGAYGLAAWTKIAKQADVIMMMFIFKELFPQTVKLENWKYYEPRCENGSSLSLCAYAIVALDIGFEDWAYKYFMKTAQIDLKGEYKRFLGKKYIGGSHPAANGGAWMTAVLGFAGISYSAEGLKIEPKLPAKWQTMSMNLVYRKQTFHLSLTRTEVEIKSDPANIIDCAFIICNQKVVCRVGEKINLVY